MKFALGALLFTTQVMAQEFKLECLPNGNDARLVYYFEGFALGRSTAVQNVSPALRMDIAPFFKGVDNTPKITRLSPKQCESVINAIHQTGRQVKHELAYCAPGSMATDYLNRIGFEFYFGPLKKKHVVWFEYYGDSKNSKRGGITGRRNEPCFSGDDY